MPISYFLHLLSYQNSERVEKVEKQYTSQIMYFLLFPPRTLKFKMVAIGNLWGICKIEDSPCS